MTVLVKQGTYYINALGEPTGLADADAVAVGDNLTRAVFRLTTDAQRRMLALYGLATLMTQTARKANDPVAEMLARYAKIGNPGWGDEKPVKPPKPKRDPLGELVEIIRSLKGPTWDEAAFRAKCEAEPGFKLAARKVPEVAAEIARRKAQSGAPGLGAL